MTDEYTTTLPQPPLQITAAYPASDGRVPESIEVQLGVEWGTDPALVDAVVSALARVADHRMPFFASGGLVPSGQPAPVTADCGRLVADAVAEARANAAAGPLNLDSLTSAGTGEAVAA